MLNRYMPLARPMKMARYLFIGATLFGLFGTAPATAAPLDFFGPPQAGDPSAFTGPLIGLNFARDFLATLLPANEGAFVGGPTGTFKDAEVNNVLPPGLQTAANVPTNGKPSPLFGAQPFTQQLLLFEEFGPEPL